MRDLKMNWNILIPSWEWDNDGLLDARANWTKPFFNNLAQKFNNSLAGPQRLHNETSHEDPSSPLTEHTLIVFLFIIILTFKQILDKEKLNVKNSALSSLTYLFNSKPVFYLISNTLFAIIFPILASMIIFTTINRQIVKAILKLKYKNKFVKLMDGTDAIWAVEDNNSKSVINVISTVQVRNSTESNGDEILEKLRFKLRDKFMSFPIEYPKLLYKRAFKMGYFYWEKNEDIAIEDFIRPLKSNGEDLTKEELNRIVSDLSNADFPYNNTATWEILVGQKPMKQNVNDDNDVKHYPILFRIHHSLGDGVVLVKLLLKTIADEGKSSLKRQMSILIPIDDLKTSIEQLFCLSNLYKVKDITLKIIKTAYKIVSVLSMVPISLVGQMLRPPDKNILHAKELEGVKICAWIKESDAGEGVLKKIKQIKNKMRGSTFSDLFVTALSASYYKYYAEHTIMRKATIPEKITAIVPIRVEKSDLNLDNDDKSLLKLENRFTVAMLTIPIKVGEKTDSPKVVELKRLMEVKRATSDLRTSADFYVNYFIMSLVGRVFPEAILRPMLKSDQASLVVSNLPGPSNITICGGHSLVDLAFFVPHRGTTGMGVTLLSYNGRVNLGLMVDRAVINNVKDAEQILKGALDELDMLDIITSKLMSSPSNGFEIHSYGK